MQLDFSATRRMAEGDFPDARKRIPEAVPFYAKPPPANMGHVAYPLSKPWSHCRIGIPAIRCCHSAGPVW